MVKMSMYFWFSAALLLSICQHFMQPVAGFVPAARNLHGGNSGLTKHIRYRAGVLHHYRVSSTRIAALSDRRTSTNEKERSGGLRILTGAYFSLMTGGVGVLAVALNRLFATPTLYDSQARTDLLGVMATLALMANGVYLMDVNIQESECVKLVGTFEEELDSSLRAVARRELDWLCSTLIQASPATSVLVYVQEDDTGYGKTLARYGVMGTTSSITVNAPIMSKCLREAGEEGQETYLPVLQNLPGKVEFTYLPANCQAVVLLPVLKRKGVVVVGCNKAKAFTPKDLAWMKAVTERATSRALSS